MNEDRFIIKIPKLKLFGYHGCYDEEKETGQEFEVEMEIAITSIDCNRFNSNRGDLHNTIDYVKIESEIKRIFNATRYDLLEELGCNISAIPYALTKHESKIFKEIYSVSVIVRKNNPIGMSVPYVEVKYIKYNNEEYWVNE